MFKTVQSSNITPEMEKKEVYQYQSRHRRYLSLTMLDAVGADLPNVSGRGHHHRSEIHYFVSGIEIGIHVHVLGHQEGNDENWFHGSPIEALVSQMTTQTTKITI
jgi:hypothetical protein